MIFSGRPGGRPLHILQVTGGCSHDNGDIPRKRCIGDSGEVPLQKVRPHLSPINFLPFVRTTNGDAPSAKELPPLSLTALAPY